MDTELQRAIKHEDSHWTEIFEAELRSGIKNDFSSFWWECYYMDWILSVKHHGC